MMNELARSFHVCVFGICYRMDITTMTPTDLKALLEKRLDEMADSYADKFMGGDNKLVDPIKFYSFTAGADSLIPIVLKLAEAHLANANEDYRGHRSAASVRSFEALADLEKELRGEG